MLLEVVERPMRPTRILELVDMVGELRLWEGRSWRIVVSESRGGPELLYSPLELVIIMSGSVS